MSNSSNDHVTAEKLYQDMQAVIRDAEALLKATAGQAGEKIQEARAKAEDTVKQAKDRLDGMHRSATQRAKEAVGDAEDYVRSNPWKSVGIAAGIGLMLGLLFNQRK
jgi:ElaB/YqjD/DUF883 family membrane-anchored ribosome-binding protein